MFRLIKKKLETLLKQRTAEKHFGIYLVSYLAKGTQALCILETARLKSIHSFPTVMYKILSWLQPCSHTVRIVNPSNFTRISRSMMILKVMVRQIKIYQL